MLTPVRRRLAALAVVVLVPSLGGCGFGYQTDKVYQPGIGVNDRSGTVDVLGAVVVSSTDGSGTFIASLVNKDLKKPSTLTAVTGVGGVESQLTGPIKVQPAGSVNLTGVGSISVKGTDVKPGRYVRLTLEFDTGQKVKVNTPIVPRAGEFSQIGSAPSGSASPSSSPSP